MTKDIFTVNNKNLTTGPKGNSEFCFLEILNVPCVEAQGNIEVKGKRNSPFSEGPVSKCFVILPNSNQEKNCKEIVCFTLVLRWCYAGWLTNLQLLQGA